MGFVPTKDVMGITNKACDRTGWEEDATAVAEGTELPKVWAGFVLGDSKLVVLVACLLSG